MSDHDPTGHVVLSGSVNWVCSICGKGVIVAEWLDDGGPFRWRWEHTPEAPDKSRGL